MTGTNRLLERVRRRQMAARFLRTSNSLMFLFSAVFAAALLATRLLGLWPDYFIPYTLIVPVALALAVALLLLRSPRPEQTAHVIDSETASKDLFLTALLIDKSLGSFQGEVVERAEEAALSVQPAKIVKINWGKPVRNAVIALAILAAGTFFLPQLDPFGREKARQKQLARKKQLDESRQAIASRKEILVKKDLKAELSDEVDRRLAELKDAFLKARPAEQKQNVARLGEQQKILGELWRQASQRQLRDALEKNPSAQRFGMLSEKQEQWKRELGQGNSDQIKKELAELRQMAKKLESMKEGAKKEEMKEELANRSRELSQFLSKEANNAPASEAMQRAMDQLAAMNVPELNADALKGFQDALGLTEMELASLAQNVRDLVALQDALQAAQLARQLNELGQLDGELCDQEGALSDYAALYAAMLAQGQGMVPGPGMGQNPGQGAGGHAPENPDMATDFKSEKSRSALTAGKILMEWKVKEMGPAGNVQGDYLDSITQVKQGVSEAILQEQVPPGYHDAIQNYFDNLEKPNAAEGALQ